MAVLNGLFSRFENLIMALDALGNTYEPNVLDYMKSRLLQEEQRSKMQDGKSYEGCNVFTLFGDCD